MFALKTLLAAGVVAFALPASADILISGQYLIVSRGAMAAGAAYFVVENTGATDDHLVGASSTFAARTELHTHIASPNGVMQMVSVPGGWIIPAGGIHVLQRGGDHVMLMGMSPRPQMGDVVTLTLTFEKAGDVPVQIVVGAPAGTVPMRPVTP